MVELIERRTKHGKTHLLPDGRIQVSTSIRPQHWDDNGTWVDADERLQSVDGKVWTTGSTPYHLSWNVEKLELRFENKRGGLAVIRLAALNDVPIAGPISAPTISERSVKVFVAPELELELRTRSHAVEIFKILHGPNAPRKLTWEVTEHSSEGVYSRLMETIGRDNARNSEGRKKAGLNRSRSVEIIHARSGPDAPYSVTEEFTGRTRFIDPDTRARTWVNEVEWPVEIDVTVSVNVTADQDDGNGREYDYWRANNFQVRAPSYARYAAARFLSVNIPQGQALDSATFTVNVTFRSGSQSATLAGQNVDTAPTWANASAFSPKTMAATTANVVTPTPGAAGLMNVDVKAICQEIINRAGWAANNAIRLGWTVVSAMTTSYMDFEDFADSGANPAKLVIVYTAAGASNALIKNAAILAFT
jgi:hypothetical protein